METKKTGIVLVVVAVVAALAGWQSKRAQEAAEPLARTVDALSNRNQEIRAVLEKLERFREESSALDRRLAELRRALPAELDVERFEAELQEWTEGLGVEVSLWEAAEPRAFDFYRKRSISVTLEGPERALNELSESRDALGRAIRWEETGRMAGELELHLTVFSRIAEPTLPPATLCSRLDTPVPPAMLWPFGGRLVELRAERHRLCAFESEHAPISRALEAFKLGREEEVETRTLLSALVGTPAPESTVAVESEPEG